MDSRAVSWSRLCRGQSVAERRTSLDGFHFGPGLFSLKPLIVRLVCRIEQCLWALKGIGNMPTIRIKCDTHFFNHFVL